MSNRSAVLSWKTRVMEWSSISGEQATLKNHGIDYDPIYVFGQGIGRAVGFLDAAGRCRPSGARDSYRIQTGDMVGTFGSEQRRQVERDCGDRPKRRDSLCGRGMTLGALARRLQQPALR